MRFEGVVYRAHDPRWVWNPTSGEGAKLDGGRFNRIGVSALYLSLTPWGAIREATPLKFPIQPRTLCAYSVDVEPIFDATNAESLKEMGMADVDLKGDWERDLFHGKVPRSHEFANRVIDAGFAGMLVSSFAYDADQGDKNLVLWEYGSVLPSKVTLIDDYNVLGTRD